MGGRALGWLLATPLAGASILGGHALAYRLTGTAPGALHEYLAHLPQLMLVLATVGVVAAALGRRGGRYAKVPFAALAAGGFVLQEHLERLAHDGSMPFLLLDRTFLIGLALQIPVSLVCLGLARYVGRVAQVARVAVRPRVIAWLPVVEHAPRAVAPMYVPVGASRCRAPPRPA